MALQIGHRRSIDIDLFGYSDFEMMDFSSILSDYDELVLLKQSKNIKIFLVDGVKVDFVNYAYPWIQSYKEVDKIRLASLPDIAAMKINAISGRGSKKDFIDIYYLLQTYSLAEILDFIDKSIVMALIILH